MVVPSILVIISIAGIILLTSRFKIQAFVSLFIVSVFLAFATLPPDKVVSTMKEGFGNTMASIGFLIILGAMIGITLEKTGGTYSIANFILSKTGEKRSVQALGITGFITGMPIFCDSGYIILNGLAKSFSARTQVAMPFMATVLATSLYSIHCLIPPHPGALAAAGIFNANIGNLIIIGTLFAIPAAIAAFFWTRWITKGKNYPPAQAPPKLAHLEPENLPPVFISFMPIIVPLLLITTKSVISLFDKGGESLLARIFYLPGDPVFALAVGVVIALSMLKNNHIKEMNKIFVESIEKAGPIIVVTAAGGMFGMVIKSTGVGEAAGVLLSGTSLGLLVPFLIGAAMKTAQGSSTVAIITTAAFVSPMLPVLGLDTEWGRLLGVLAMGSGTMIISHANDSYFWVLSNFAEIDTNTTLKVYSPATMIMGLVSFACVLITSFFVL